MNVIQIYFAWKKTTIPTAKTLRINASAKAIDIGILHQSFVVLFNYFL
jgi:hypothetical protein